MPLEYEGKVAIEKAHRTRESNIYLMSPRNFLGQIGEGGHSSSVERSTVKC